MKNTKLIGVIGHFAFGLNMTDGQTVKTVTVTKALEDRFGDDEVLKSDTHGGAKFLFKLPFTVINMLKKANNILIFPAQRGLRMIVPMLVFFNRFYHRRLHYCVIGGWLPELLKTHGRLEKQLHSFFGLYVETSFVRDSLIKKGFKNVWLIPNCKQLKIVSEKELKFFDKPPYKLCTFSRVLKEKGIEDAVKAVSAVNSRSGKTVFTLDIYGQVDESQKDWFENLKNSFPPYISYRGVVPYDKSSEVLNGYYALLFPTRFYTEGVPGTIIDAYAAGVPVISSNWQSCAEIVEDGVTGHVYSFKDEQELEKTLEKVLRQSGSIIELKKNCIKKAENYLPENALSELFEQIEN